jgi:sugar phosphate isomerase/epimerase
MRYDLQKDFSATLRKISGMGFREVEIPQLYGRSAKEMEAALEQNHLKATSFLCSYQQLRDSLPEIIRAAKALGVQYAGCSWIPHGDRLTREEAEEAAALFNKVGAELKARHLHFIYHTHGYEFVPTGSGETLMDVLVKEMKPGIADFEMDIFWVWAGGQDPALLLKKYPGRFVALHLKDMKEGTPTGSYSGSAPEESSVALGSGAIDIPAVLRAALQTGVKKFYIEDEAREAASQIPVSLKYIQSLP